MAEFKFSCPQCGQHLSGNEQWSGHQIKCPSCAATLTVPQAPGPPAAAAPAPGSLVPQPPVSQGPRLSAGATQTTRAPVPGSIPIRQLVSRPPKKANPLLNYAIAAVVLVVLVGAAYIYLPPWLNKLESNANSKPTQAAPASTSGGAGPLGEVNEAMDVSDALDGGSSSAPRPAAARQPAAAQTPTPSAVTPAVRTTNTTVRAKAKQPGRINPATGTRQ